MKVFTFGISNLETLVGQLKILKAPCLTRIEESPTLKHFGQRGRQMRKGVRECANEPFSETEALAWARGWFRDEQEASSGWARSLVFM